MAGTASSSLKARLEDLERRKAGLEAELAGAEAPAPRLHPNMAEVYRESGPGGAGGADAR